MLQSNTMIGACPRLKTGSACSRVVLGRKRKQHRSPPLRPWHCDVMQRTKDRTPHSVQLRDTLFIVFYTPL
ncbi:hypothetical protein V5799_008856 [Amblyomma americanum]|uniref:Uncharacterized protein n=1 Tax=Amblyomma americanum TaxID=6943 RepID=A0AAQ4FD48_AMBAM